MADWAWPLLLVLVLERRQKGGQRQGGGEKSGALDFLFQ